MNLSDIGYPGCKPRKTLMDPNVKFSQDEGEFLDNPTQYRRLIGKLLYLTITRLDLSYSVNRLSQFLAKPRVVPHLQVVYRCPSIHTGYQGIRIVIWIVLYRGAQGVCRLRLGFLSRQQEVCKRLLHLHWRFFSFLEF